MINSGQAYKFDTSMLLDRLPGIYPEPVILTVSEVSYDDRTVKFTVSPCTEHISGEFKIFSAWFRDQLPHLTDCALNDPLLFERFIASGAAQLVTEQGR